MPSTSKNKWNLTENQRFEKINGKIIRTIENLDTKKVLQQVNAVHITET